MASNPAPLVSIVIPTYNQPAFLREAINSVFAQTFRDYEIIVVNDGSSDDTAQQLLQYGARIRTVYQDNQGTGCARNRGMDEAQGRYIAFLDHDDLWHPSKLEIQVSYMLAHPECAGSSVPFAYSTAPEKVPFDLNIRNGDGIVPNPLQVFAGGQIFLLSSSLMIDRTKAGDLRFDCRRKCFEDLPLQLRLLARGPFGIAGDEVLVMYRMHASNTTKSAMHFEYGMQHLRELIRGGGFDPVSECDRQAIKEFISFFGRICTIRLLKAELRGHSIRRYMREFPHQMRARRFKFLLLFPLLSVMPSIVIRRIWSVNIDI